jgi:hypothetical protein
MSLTCKLLLWALLTTLSICGAHAQFSGGEGRGASERRELFFVHGDAYLVGPEGYELLQQCRGESF